MRTHIIHIGAGELNYEIRNIIRVAERLQTLGVKINLENIGDPVAKGEKIPEWMKRIVARLAMEDCSYGYCPTQGILETRQFLAEQNNRHGGVRIAPEDIIFFNGLGDAITKVYGFLARTARIITPSPTYTTHSASEAAHAGLPAITYALDPHRDWRPNLRELRQKVRYNPTIAGILVINPDNPTGAVYTDEDLIEIVHIAKEFDLFIIADEIYQNLVFEGHRTLPLVDVIGNVPGLAMKGVSKELPWPGSRCGWIEVYNGNRDRDFAAYTRSILNAKMVEVCSTTLPQKAIPDIYRHPEYPVYLESRRRRYQRFSDLAYERLSAIPGVVVNRTKGAFYMSVVFEPGLLNDRQSLPLQNEGIRELVDELVEAPGVALDKRFVYYLLAATGLCVVPLTSFNSDLNGFRFTLLDPDEERFQNTVETLAWGVRQYVSSSSETAKISREALVLKAHATAR
ncbi:putative enzyme [uncultured Desulfatiglans sp.]|nr:putative enzyme [uncultured Desulfatiglans sp.]